MSDPGRAVFLSYASQDAAAAKRIADALRAAGVEVWFDQNELVGGDAWDAKIRQQIKECALFVPIITWNTNARAEGYFRREWKQAVERTHDMADDVPFLFPIVLDDVTDATARVPAKFREVQWTRLRLDETPGELAARVARLLAGGVQREPGRPRPGTVAPGGGAAPPKKSRPAWLPYVWAGVGVLFAVIYAVRPMWQPATVASAASVAPTVSEARQLAAKARTLVDAIDSTADDFAAAESLIKRALELDATDGEIWAVSSRVNSSYLSRGFERSATRRETARSQAERAVKLAPDLPEAWLALGRGLGMTDAVRAEEAFRRGLALAPEDGRILLGIGSIYRQSNRFDEALAIYEQAATRPESRALARYDQYLIHFYCKRFAEADRCLRESISFSKSSNMVAGLALLELTWRGDIAQAQQALADAPASMRGQTRMVLAGVLVNLMAGQPDAALRDFDRLPADYVNDAWYTGPKALLVGLAHHQAGRPEAARIAWESGLAVVRRRLQDAPNDLENHLRLGELLAWTGQTEAALQEARIFNELHRGRSTDWTYSTVRIHAALGRVDDALPLLEQLLTASTSNRWPLTPALLRIDPLWSKLRGDPRFLQLVTRAEAAERAALPPRDWPKDPELKRAIALIEGLESIPDDFALAEEIARRAVDRAPTNLEAATVMARVHGQYLLRGFDRSDARSALAQRYAERAAQLAPEEPEALFALGTYLRNVGSDLPRAERVLRRAMELDPANPRPARILANVVFEAGRRAESFALAEENVRRFPRDPLTHYELSRIYRNAGRFADFERELEATLALAPVPNAIVWKARAQFALHNDLAGMRAWLDRVPERVRGVERTVFTRFLHAALSGQPEQGLEALRGFPQKWFEDFEYIGPTALLAGELLAQQGKRELARRQYEAALLETQRLKALDPASPGVVPSEFWSLLGLGRTEGAQAAYRLLLESLDRPYRQGPLNNWWFTTVPASLLIGERETAVTLLRESIAQLPSSREAFRLRIQLDPRMAPWRDDPEIMELLAEPRK